MSGGGPAWSWQAARADPAARLRPCSAASAAKRSSPCPLTQLRSGLPLMGRFPMGGLPQLPRGQISSKSPAVAASRVCRPDAAGASLPSSEAAPPPCDDAQISVRDRGGGASSLGLHLSPRGSGCASHLPFLLSLELSVLPTSRSLVNPMPCQSQAIPLHGTSPFKRLRHACLLTGPWLTQTQYQRGLRGEVGFGGWPCHAPGLPTVRNGVLVSKSIYWSSSFTIITCC